MENALRSTATPTTRRPSLIRRMMKLNPLFTFVVVIPTVVASVYYGLIASDIYVSESRFVVRSAEKQAQSTVVSALLQGTGFSTAQDGAYPVIDYIESRDALRELNLKNSIVDSYSKPGDFISRFHTVYDNSFESLWKYYGRRIVSVSFDTTSSITTLQVRAYSAQTAKRINDQLLRMSERLINQMNARAAEDGVRFAKARAADAADAARNAAASLAAFRRTNTIFDPDKQSAQQLQQVVLLQNRLLDAQTRVAELKSVSPNNPQIPALKVSIATMQKQIDAANGDVAGRAGSLAEKAASYARRQLDADFADKRLASALAALDSAEAEAQRKQLYLETIVTANTPDKAIEPYRFAAVATVLLIGLVVWGILTLLLASIREHHA
ncbi:hypothetical protein [Paraburkholderia sp. A2WS-5]|uniref:hypothetical protein n=1 Tax=Paraburkholderia sp. A2WS-5 TaxID=3028372 RepID=UPI003B9E27EC